MILFIDNYDSFTYNLVQYFGSIEPDIYVIRNDAMTLEEVNALKPDQIILSPGPGYPKEAGICEEIIKTLSKTIPTLGVCLGHQGICEVFGAKVVPAKKRMHGKQSQITIDATDPIFKGLSPNILAARYHSLIAEKNSIPDCLTILGTDDTGEIMAVRHKDFPIYGLQFHPESILTPDGMTILTNFLSIK